LLSLLTAGRGFWSRWTQSKNGGGVGRGGRSQKNGGVLVEVDAVKKMGFGHGGRGGCTTAPCRTRSFAAGSFAVTQGTVLTSVLLVCTEARRVTLLRLSKILTKRQKKRPSLSPLKNANHKEGRITWEAGRGGHHLPLADSCCDGPTRIEPAKAVDTAALLPGSSAACTFFFIFFIFLLQEVVDRPGWFHEAPARIAGARRVDSEL